MVSTSPTDGKTYYVETDTGWESWIENDRGGFVRKPGAGFLLADLWCCQELTAAEAAEFYLLMEG